MSKKSHRRKGSSDKTYRDRYPFDKAFEPQWKKDLRKIKENENGSND